MKTSAARTAKIMAAIATPVAVVATGALVYSASYSAFTGTTRSSGNDWATGSVALTDDDAGAARFQVVDMKPGDTDTKCIKVTANASVPGEVRGYAINAVKSAQGLENHIDITMEAGNGGSYASCDGFTKTEDIISSVPLSQIALINNYEDGIGGWQVAKGTQARTYRVTWAFDTDGLTQQQIDALQGARTGIDIQWELQSN